MPILALSSNPTIRDWETSTTNVDLLVDGVPLSGAAAAAYLYGQALTTVRFENTLDGVQLTDGRFQFPPAPAPASGPDDRQWVSLTDVADALRYKYGVDPLIEFSPGLGSRAYSIPDINRILELLNREFSGQFSLPLITNAAVLAATQATFERERIANPTVVGATYNATAVATLLNTASTNVLTPATSAELHEQLTEGGDIYVDRNGAFYINGIRTRAMDLAVTSRVLVQENLSAEYKAMMDDLAERNNTIALARSITNTERLDIGNTLESLRLTYGMEDVLSELTGGEVTDDEILPLVPVENTATTVRFATVPGWADGARVQVNFSGNGLLSTEAYLVRKISDYEYELSTVRKTGNTLVNMSQPVTAEFSVVITTEYTRLDPILTPGYFFESVDAVNSGEVDLGDDGFDTNKKWADVYGSYEFQFLADPGNPGWDTGTRIYSPLPLSERYYVREYSYIDVSRILGVRREYSTPKTPPSLAANTDCYVRNLGNGKYQLYGTEAQAKDLFSTAGAIRFDSSSGSPPSFLTRTETYFETNPELEDGARVLVTKDSGTLVPGTYYYLRRNGNAGYLFFDTADNAIATGSLVGLKANPGDFGDISQSVVQPSSNDANAFARVIALLNTLISNKVRDGDLDQAKLQAITGQLQNNTEAMTALIKAFSDLNAALVQALR